MEFVTVSKELWESVTKTPAYKHVELYNALLAGQVIELPTATSRSVRSYLYVVAAKRGYKAAVRQKIDGSGYLIRWVKKNEKP